MRTVLVTGGTGFIGSNLARALLREGCAVRVLRRQRSSLRLLQGLDIEYVIGDIRDVEAVRRAVKGCDTVFHTAAIVSYWRRERDEMFDVNIGGTRAVVTACLELDVERVVHTSSTAAIGFTPGQMADENSEFNWWRFDIGYRISKHCAEQEVLRGIRLGLPAVIVCPAVVIGPGDTQFHGGRLIRDIFKKRIFYYPSGGTNIVYIDDVVKGHIEAARQGRIGERYLLSGENVTYREMVTTIAEVVNGIKPVARIPQWAATAVASIAELVALFRGTKPWVPRELVTALDHQTLFTHAKASRELCFVHTPLRDAVQRTFAWYQENRMLF
jgi:dihydroflavonol-4-reductase